MEVTIPVSRLTKMYLGIHIFVPSISFAAYLMLWGWCGFMTFNYVCIAIAMFVLGSPVHELIHYACFTMFGGASRNNVHFRFDRKNLVPYVVCQEKISAIRYKTSALAPFVVLGLIPSLCGLFFRNSAIEVAGVLATVSCSGDVIMYWLLSAVGNSDTVWRYSTKPGKRIERVGFNVESYS